ncbi:MAG: hypothetical protein J7J52_01150 [Deltaproteobacteria bacterium]|nr:hypothetical protein [Deltaproteobacteria bacterium]
MSSDKGLTEQFHIRISPELHNFIKMLNREGINVGEWIRNKLWEFKNEYPHEIKKQIKQKEKEIEELKAKLGEVQ